MLKEFKDFVIRGNVIDLAIAVIIGGAFGKIVASLVGDVLMPVIGLLLGGVNFSELALTVGDAVVKYGAFIQSIIDFLVLLGNADDDTAFLRVVNFPARGIGARSLENLQATAHQINSSLYNAAASLTGRAGQTVGAFVRLIEALRQETANLPLPEMVEHIIEKSGLAQHYRTEKEGQERLENLDELINAAATFVDDDGVVVRDAGEGGALASFLAHASLEAGEHQAGEGQ